MVRDFAILYLSSSFVQNHLPSVFHMYSSVCSSLSCIRDSWVSLIQSFMMFYHSILWVHALEIPSPYGSQSDDCNSTWPESGIRGCAGFGIIERLWQTRGLETKVQLWPILSCVIRISCAQQILYFEIHAYLYRWSGNFLVSFCILFH